jgi:hypothetical protein
MPTAMFTPHNHKTFSHKQQQAQQQEQPEVQQSDRESLAMLKGFLSDWRKTMRVPHAAMAHFKLLNPRLFVGQFLPLLLSHESVHGVDQMPPDTRLAALRQQKKQG